MNDRVAYLYPGELMVSREPCAVSTVVGSCVAVFLWDARLRLGGMNHYLLPQGEASPRYGVNAVRALVDKLLALGGAPETLAAKVFGGAHVLGHAPAGNHLGKQNSDLAFSLLQDFRIRVLAADVGGTRGRRVVCHTGDGSAWVKEL